MLSAVSDCVFSGCAKQGAESSGENGEAKYTIGMSQCNLGEPWRVQMNADIEQAADRADDIIFVGIDGLPQEGRAYVAQGILAASFEYPTGGPEAVETALVILNGRDVPKEITLDSSVYQSTE